MSEATQWMELLLRKREMDRRAAETDEAQRAAQTRQLFQAGSQLAGSLDQAMDQWKKDKIANSLMNTETPPTATAVNPAIQKQVMAGRVALGAGGPVAPATGGEEERHFRLVTNALNPQGRKSNSPMDLAAQHEARRTQTAAYQTDLAAAEAEWNKRRGPAMSNWGGVGQWFNGKTAGEEFMDGSDVLYNKQQAKPKTQSSPASAASGPPAEAVEMLRSNPSLAPLFEEKYGKGTAFTYLP